MFHYLACGIDAIVGINAILMVHIFCTNHSECALNYKIAQEVVLKKSGL